MDENREKKTHQSSSINPISVFGSFIMMIGSAAAERNPDGKAANIINGTYLLGRTAKHDATLVAKGKVNKVRRCLKRHTRVE